MPTDQVESVVLGVAAGSRVTSFDVASYRSTSEHTSRSERHMCVEEVAGDGTVGATLIAWNYFGTCRGGGGKPSHYPPPQRSRGRWRRRASRSLSLSQKFGDGNSAGLAIFRASGAAPPPQ